MSPAPGGPVRRPLVAGNWKMNLTHLEAIALVQKLAFTLRERELDAVEVVVLPPFTDLRSVQTLVEGDRLALGFGAQDLSPYDHGAYTGDVSGVMLAGLRCGYVVVGHSERRQHHHEGDDVVAAKLAAAYRHGLTPILCVGEPAEVRDAGQAVPHVLAQLDAALSGGGPAHENGGGVAGNGGGVAGRLGAGAELVLAYEPVWAIGTGRSAQPHDAQEMCAALRARLGGLAGADVARGTRILYGGSVTPGTAAETFGLPDVDGGLIGGASLVAEDFATVCRAALS